MANILIIEDEEAIADALSYNLRRDGHEARIAYDGEEGIDQAREWLPDLILLDLMLPGIDGLEVCRELRAESNVAMIMISGKAAEADRVIGLELGADDYIVKPFHMREVLARVRAVLRRRQPSAPRAGRNHHRGISFDPGSRTAHCDGKLLELTRKEFDLLGALRERAGRVVARDELLATVWGEDDRDPHTLEVHMRRLREKVERDPNHPRRLVTVRGVGYKYVK